MFSARDKVSNRIIHSIDPFWKNKLKELQELVRAGTIVCQGCKECTRKRWLAEKEKSAAGGGAKPKRIPFRFRT